MRISFPKSNRRWIIGASLITCVIFLTGCGGSGAPESEEEASSTVVESPESTSPDPESGTSDSETKQTDAARPESALPSGPAINEGMQLPEGAVPDASGTLSRPGPTRPGEGGIEMPDSEGDSAGNPSGRPVELADWSTIDSALKSAGKITVVDLWSTACQPCIEEFPGLVRLSGEMPDRVRCVSVSLDYDGRKTQPAESYRDNVNAFLNAMNADFTNYLCQTPNEDVYKAAGLPSIPAVLIYDADGNLVKKFVDSGETIGFTYEKDIIPFVQNLAG